MDKTVLQTVEEAAEGWRMNDIKALLGRCNFKGDTVHRKVSFLSGGEKVRGSATMDGSSTLELALWRHGAELGGDACHAYGWDSGAIASARSSVRKHRQCCAVLGFFISLKCFHPGPITCHLLPFLAVLQARLALCKFMVTPATLLVLDEPTNHLDIPTKEMLEVQWHLLRSSSAVPLLSWHGMQRLTAKAPIALIVTPSFSFYQGAFQGKQGARHVFWTGT